MIIPVILSGGSGTRLWPLSTPEKPKQFLPLVGDRTFFQQTLHRLEGLKGLEPPIVVCNERHRFLVAGQLLEMGIEAGAIVLETEGRNTAPAIAVAAALASGTALQSEAVQARANIGSGAGPILLVLPADHVVADIRAFHAAVETAIDAAEAGRLVTFGIVPTAPETGYGYIEQGPTEGAWRGVTRFVEKPDPATAEAYLASGEFLWNSGMFVFGADTFLTELMRWAPAIHASCLEAASGIERQGGFVRLGQAFLASPADSVDYAVMERTDRAAVVPLDAGWSDVGSWAALFDALERDADGNVIVGKAVSLDAHGNLIVSGLRRIALLGVEDLVIVDSGNDLLVMRRDQSQRVKELLQQLKVTSS